MKLRYLLTPSVLMFFALTPLAAQSPKCEPGPHVYQDNRDGTVTDKCTNLVWQQATNPTFLLFADAQAYCATLTLDNKSDWRLPTIFELQTIVDYGRVDPPTDPVLQIPVRGPTIPYVYLWSTTHWGFYPPNTPVNWTIEFSDGHTAVVQSGSSDQFGAVLFAKCVRSKH